MLSRAHLKYHLPKDSFRNLLRSHSTCGPSHELVTHLLSLYPISVTSIITSVQLLSRVRLCDPMHCSLTGFPVHHQIPELAQTYVHQASDAIQPSHPLLFPSPPAFNLSQHQGLFQLSNCAGCNGLRGSVAVRSHGRGQGRRPRRATPPRSSGAPPERSYPTAKEGLLRGRRRARSYSTFRVRRGSREKIPLIQGKEQRLRLEQQ